MEDVVRVSGLCVEAENAAGEPVALVNDVSFSIPKGEVLALIGESGSGKTTIALALMGYARPGCRIAAGNISVAGTDVTSLDAPALAALRGSKITYIAQSAASAFNPSMTIMKQVVEAALIHGLLNRAAAEAKAIELFRALALPQPETIGHRYPHQLSGGQLQRMMAAMALVTDPALVIFDEPTTALDVTTQVEVLRAFKNVIKGRDTTAVYVSHDLSVVAQMATRIVVLNGGTIREAGATDAILHTPADAYTQTLMAAAKPPSRIAPVSTALSTPPPLLDVLNLTAGYGPIGADRLPRTVILKDLSLKIEAGKTLGVIGESGSGKSTLARVIAGLLAPAQGSIIFKGEPLPSGLAGRTRDQFRRIQIVFQNADTALNPSHSVGRILARPLAFYHGLDGEARRKRIAQLLDLTRLPTGTAARKSGELSGGQKQRVNLARALAANPDLILCDEVTSALDTVVGAAILDLLAELRRELNVSYMFISHDISTVRSICDDIVVLYAGRKVQAGARPAFQIPPLHPYTELLVSSVPEMRRGWLEDRQSLSMPPAMASGGADICSFLGRCPARLGGVCDVVPPPRVMLSSGNEILCHRAESELRAFYSGQVQAMESRP